MKTPLALTAVSISLAVAQAAGGDFGGTVDVDVTRTSTYLIDTGSDSFGEARGTYEIRWDFDAQLDDINQGFFVNEPSNSLTVIARRTGRDFFASGSGDVRVSNFQFNASAPQFGALEVDWDLERDDTSDLVVDGSLRAGYEFDAAKGLPGGRRYESFLFTRVESDRHVMRFLGGGEGLVDTGDGFAVDVTLNGRWDPNSIETGGVRFIEINNGYQITDFFTYDETSDTTRFAAISDSYLRDPGLRFDLIGAAVPAPSALTTLGLITGLCARRSRR